MFAQYKLYIYGAIGLLLISLVGSTYFFYSNNKNKAIQIEQLNKENKFWQDSLIQVQQSHNDYVIKLETLQKSKDKIQDIYARKVEEIGNEKIDTISKPTVLIPYGMSAFSAYSAAMR